MKPIDPLHPVNRIKDFVTPPPVCASKDEDDEDDEDEDEDEEELQRRYDREDGSTADEAVEDDSLIGSGDDGDDDNDDDDDDGDDGDDSEDTPENYLRTKVCLALEENSVLTFGKVIVHEDPQDEDKLLVTMQLDKFTEDEDMPNLEGGEMRDVSIILLFEGKGDTGPKRRILHLDQLSQLFDDKNWKKKAP